jgi:hypothetical protein
MASDDEEGASTRIIAGRAIADWNKCWERIPDGFKKLQSALRGEVGLFAAKQNGLVVYIGSAVQRSGGLRAGLARGRLKDQTGNTSYGMQRVRAASDAVEAYVIRIKPPATRDDIEDLKWALIDVHKPDMNAPRDIVAAARKAAYAKRLSRS